MKITIICIGILKSGPEYDLLKEYLKRFQWTVDILELPSKKGLQGITLKEFEAKQILSHLPAGAPLFALDERGTNLTSPDFAKLFGGLQNSGKSHLYFCIGGADGLHESVHKRAAKLLSFGQLTWPHMLVRVMLVEQLYRAQQILAGHPYHRI